MAGLTLCANGRNRYRDSPLRGGALLIGCDRGERQSRRGLAAEPSVTMAALISSSTVDSELRWFSTLRITSLYVTS
jgi:hypothetical protein